MAVDPDDEEGLSWGTERDATHIEAPVVAEPVDEADEDEPGPPANNSVFLVVYGIFAGIFLLYVVGWIIAVQTIDNSGAGALALVLDRAAQFLAFLSPAIWFFGVLLMVPNTRARIRVILLVIGVLVLAPWPFILGY
jgi:hypothetical protein